MRSLGCRLACGAQYSHPEMWGSVEHPVSPRVQVPGEAQPPGRAVAALAHHVSVRVPPSDPAGRAEGCTGSSRVRPHAALRPQVGCGCTGSSRVRPCAALRPGARLWLRHHHVSHRPRPPSDPRWLCGCAPRSRVCPCAALRPARLWLRISTHHVSVRVLPSDPGQAVAGGSSRASVHVSSRRLACSTWR